MRLKKAHPQVTPEAARFTLPRKPLPSIGIGRLPDVRRLRVGPISHARRESYHSRIDIAFQRNGG